MIAINITENCLKGHCDHLNLNESLYDTCLPVVQSSVVYEWINLIKCSFIYEYPHIPGATNAAGNENRGYCIALVIPLANSRHKEQSDLLSIAAGNLKWTARICWFATLHASSSLTFAPYQSKWDAKTFTQLDAEVEKMYRGWRLQLLLKHKPNYFGGILFFYCLSQSFDWRARESTHGKEKLCDVIKK